MRLVHVATLLSASAIAAVWEPEPLKRPFLSNTTVLAEDTCTAKCIRNTGGTCRWFSCNSWRGETSCVDNKCICKLGECAMNGKCFAHAECNRDTGGTCNLLGCRKSRGSTHCMSGRCICSKEGDCALDGKCMSQSTSSRVEHEDSRMWPPCREVMPFRSFASQAASWCDPTRVPEEKRVPAKLQGLYWLKNLQASDVAACFSTGTWDAENLTMTLKVYSDFVWIYDYMGQLASSSSYLAGTAYVFKFSDDNLNHAEIRAQGPLPIYVFDLMTSLLFTEDQDEENEPGEKWNRPSYAGSTNYNLFEYQVWRILDGKLKVNEANFQKMLSCESDNVHGSDLIHYSDDCTADLAAALQTSESKITVAAAVGLALVLLVVYVMMSAPHLCTCGSVRGAATAPLLSVDT